MPSINKTNIGLSQHTGAEHFKREDYVLDMKLIDSVLSNQISTERLNKDANDIYTEIHQKRIDGSLFKKSVLSGGASPLYTTRTVTYYAANGTTVTSTLTYTLNYIGDDLTSEVIV